MQEVMALCFQRIFSKVKWEKVWEIEVFYHTSDKNLSHKSKCGHSDWALLLAFQPPFLCPCLTSSSMTGSTLACPSPSTPSPTKHSSISAQWKYTVYYPKCSRSFWIINSPSDLLCRAVQYCLTLRLAFPCSIRVLRVLQNQMVLNLDFPPTGAYRRGFA